MEGWIFQMEQYFSICNVNSSKYQAKYGAACLKDNVAVWWRNLLQGTQIEEWKEFKEALIQQFKPVNSSKIARDKLARLKQNKSVQEYIFAFRAIILEIEDIAESEKLDRFVRGLKERTRQEVELRDPQTLDEAARIAERFDTITYNVAANFRQSIKFEEKDDKGVRPMELDFVDRKPLTNEEREKLRRFGGCFYCRERGHMANNCPKKRQRKLNVVEIEEKGKEREMGECEGNAKQYHKENESTFINTVEDSQIDLLYYDGKIKDREVKVLVDGGSIGNFISEELAKRLNLNTAIVNGQNIIFAGGASKFSNKEAYAVKLSIDNHCERINLRLAPLPHHDIILGKPWLDYWNPFIDWPTSTIVIKNHGVDVTLKPTAEKPKKTELNFISAKQMFRALKKGNDEFIFAVVKEIDSNLEGIQSENEANSKRTETVLKEFEDVFPDKIPPGLPPEREFDHKIELEKGVEPPSKPAYKMSQDELKELRTQLTELLESGRERTSSISDADGENLPRISTTGKGMHNQGYNWKHLCGGYHNRPKEHLFPAFAMNAWIFKSFQLPIFRFFRE